MIPPISSYSSEQFLLFVDFLCFQFYLFYHFSISMKNILGTLIGIALKVYIAFGSIGILMILIEYCLHCCNLSRLAFLLTKVTRVTYSPSWLYLPLTFIHMDLSSASFFFIIGFFYSMLCLQEPFILYLDRIPSFELLQLHMHTIICLVCCWKTLDLSPV